MVFASIQLYMETVRLSPAEEARFDQLAATTRRKVYNLAYRLSMNTQDAEDLTQEAFYRAYRNFGSYEGERPFENWIFRIVSRLFLDLTRARRRRVQTVSYDAPRRTDSTEDTLMIESQDHGPNPQQVLLNHQISEEFLRALNSLRPEQRDLILRADIEGAAYEEIATEVGVPVGTVRSRLHRAHKKLRASLTGLDLRTA